MPLPRLTWAGLLVATFGWGLLLTYPLIASLSGDGSAIRDPARFILIFGENAVVTGFAIAILGAMEKVMDLLGRQAATVHPSKTVAAVRGTQLAQQQLAAQQLQAQQFQASQIAANQLAANQLAASQLQAVQQLSPAQLMTARQTNEIVTRGALAGRDYVLFRDGSVVVETLLGPRRFLSLNEAQEFIGAN
jgi:hypothetical protein